MPTKCHVPISRMAEGMPYILLLPGHTNYNLQGIQKIKYVQNLK